MNWGKIGLSLILKGLLNPLQAIQVLRGNYIIYSPRFLFELLRKKDGKKYLKEIQADKDFHKLVIEKYRAFQRLLDSEKFEVGGSAGENMCEILYAITRTTRPINVVETGVAGGLSTSYILKALDENQKGTLYSIDFKNPLGVTLPAEKETGWLIPQDLKYRWKFIEGKSKEKLGPLLKELKTIELFFHDSEHSYENMLYEFRTIWPYLRNDFGALIADDVNSNFAFSEFCKEIGKKDLRLKTGIGGIRRT